MNDKSLVKEYFLERLRKVFKPPFFVYTNVAELPSRLQFFGFIDDAMVYLADMDIISTINFGLSDIISAVYVKFRRNYSVLFQDRWLYDIYCEESLDSACQGIIDCIQTWFKEQKSNE